MNATTATPPTDADARPDARPGGGSDTAGPDTFTATAVLASALALFLVHLGLTYPGVMTWDSGMHYDQALTGRFSDWFPPIMSRLWRLLLLVTNAGSALLVLHLACYWATFALIAAALARAGRRRTAWAMLGIGLLPHIALLSTFIHKDVGHAVAATLAFAIVLSRRSRGLPLGWPAGIAVALLLGYATLVRANGAFATAPLALYAFFPRSGASRYRLVVGTGLSAVLVGVSLPLAFFANFHLMKAERTYQILSLVHYDLAGIAHFSRDAAVYPERVPSLAVVDRCYSARLWDKIGFPYCNPRVGLNNGVTQGAKTSAWIKGAITHPVAYASHRLAHFNEAMFGAISARYWDWGTYPSPVIGTLPRGRIEPLTVVATDGLANSPIFAPLTSYALGMAVLLSLAFRRTLGNAWLQAGYYIAFSSMLYTTAYLFIGVAAMYRYQQLGLTGALVGAVLLFAGSARHEYRRLALTLALPTAAAGIAVAVARTVLPPIA